MNLKPVLMSWSGGKDSCLALFEIQKARNYRVAALLTTVTRDYDRISKVQITKGASNQEYETNLIEAVSAYRVWGIDSVVFGDLFLEDIKTYRDQFLARHDLRGIYPVWLRDTTEFIREFIDLGFKAIITCVNADALDSSFAGMIIDDNFLSALPASVDPCGENGEFHTFVFDGPNFAQPVEFSVGETVLRDGFWFCDLLPQ